MAKKNYDQMAAEIIEKVGGKDNISLCFHCVTRLRFNVKDMSLIETEEVKKIPGVLGAQIVGDQFQVIIGQDVADAYDAICNKTGLAKEEAIDENLDGGIPGKKKFSIAKIFESIAKCVIPMMPAMVAGGLTLVILNLCTQFGVMDTASSTYRLLYGLSQATFYFAPIFVGLNAAKQFGATPALGMLMGAVLVYPDIVGLLTAGEAVTLFGLPVYAASYTSTIFPTILCVLVLAQVEKFLKKHTPTILHTLLVPLLTMFIMLPLAFCALAPLGSFLGTYLSKVIVWLYETLGFVGIAVLAAFYPFLVMTGMHMGLVTYAFQVFMTQGFDPICYTANILANSTQGAAALAVAIKSKDQSVKSAGISGAATAILGGIMEPALYGVNMPRKTPLYCAMAGAAIGGAIVGLGKAVCYVFGPTSVLGLMNYMGGTTANLVWMAVGYAAAVVSTFVLTFIFYKEEA